jgi:hypothetical protein
LLGSLEIGENARIAIRLNTAYFFPTIYPGKQNERRVLGLTDQVCCCLRVIVLHKTLVGMTTARAELSVLVVKVWKL